MKRLSIVVAVVVMLGASACTPPPPPELAAGCYEGPFGFGGVEYVGPINTVDNATSHQAADCSGAPTDQTVVYGPSETEADAACVAIGKTNGAWAEINGSGSGYWACVA